MAITAENRASVLELYTAYFNRASDTEGVDYWLNEMDVNEWTIDEVAQSFAEQDEYTAIYGSLDNSETVDTVYLNVLNRAATDADMEYWAEQLDNEIFEVSQFIQAIVAAATEEIEGVATHPTDKAIVDNKTEVSEYAYDNNNSDKEISLADVTDDEDTVTEGKTSVDEATIDGESLTLTTDEDTLVGTSANDLFTAESGTLNNNDKIIDSSLTDSDIMNITIANAADAAIQGDISNIERINVDFDMISGASIDATNITGATLTLSSEKFGFNGDASALVLGDNNVVAGSNIDTLTVTGLEDGVVDTGSATTATITTDGASDDVNLIVNSDIAAQINTSTGDLNITATADAEVTVTGSADFGLITKDGAGSLTLTGTAANFTTDEITGVEVLKLNAGTVLDMEDMTVGSVEVAATTITNITNAQGNTFTVSTANVAALAIIGSGTAGDTVTVNVNADQVTGALAVTAVDASTINFSEDVDTVTSLTIEGNAALTVEGDVTFTNIIQTTTSDKVTITGTGDVTITDTNVEIDASGLTGDLTYTTTQTGDISVSGSTGDNDFIVATTTGSIDIETGNGETTVTAAALTSGDLVVTGGTGADTVTVTGGTINAGTVAAQLGAGDDTVAIDSSAAASTYALEFGAGDDTLSLVDAADISVDTFTISGLENIGIAGNTATLTATIGASELTGQSYSIAAIDTVDDATTAKISALTVAVAAADTTVDLSALTIDATAVAVDASALLSAATITGSSVADTVTVTGAFANTINTGAGNDIIIADSGVDTIDAGAGDDSINAGAGGDVLTGGTGSDTFVIATLDSGENTALNSTLMDVITDFNIAEFDILDLDQVTLVATAADSDAIDVSAADEDSNLVANDVYANVNTAGILTLSEQVATNGGSAVIDTLAEWIDVAEIVLTTFNADAAESLAFEFDGSTYVISDTGADVTENVIELTGVTGIDALAITAGVDTLVIA